MIHFVQWCGMHGYAAYVWPAYGVVMLVLVMNLLSVKWQRTRTFRLLRRWFGQS